jgi:hypothetical protein
MKRNRISLAERANWRTRRRLIAARSLLQTAAATPKPSSNEHGTCSYGLGFTSHVYFHVKAVGFTTRMVARCLRFRTATRSAHEGAPVQASAWESARCVCHVARGGFWGNLGATLYTAFRASSDIPKSYVRLRVVTFGAMTVDPSVLAENSSSSTDPVHSVPAASLRTRLGQRFSSSSARVLFKGQTLKQPGSFPGYNLLASRCALQDFLPEMPCAGASFDE